MRPLITSCLAGTIGFLAAQALVDGVKSWRGQTTIILDRAALADVCEPAQQ